MAGLVHAATLTLQPGDTAVGAVSQVAARYEDTLSDIARVHGLGYGEIRLANPRVDSLLPGAGTPVLIPAHFVLPAAERRGIVLNLAEMRLYYFPLNSVPPQRAPSQRVSPRSGPPPDGGAAQSAAAVTGRRTGTQLQVVTFPVGIGRQGWETPIGSTYIAELIEGPSWTPPPSIRQEYLEKGVVLPERVPPGPDNPLGDYALRLGHPLYLLHGTNKPDGIGMRVSHGCIRLYPEDIEALFHQVSLGTPVTIVDQPYKVGWQGDTLLLEVHPPAYRSTVAGRVNTGSGGVSPAADWHQGAAGQPALPGALVEAIIDATVGRPAAVDWTWVHEAVRAPTGMPVAVGRRLYTSLSDGR